MRGAGAAGVSDGGPRRGAAGGAGPVHRGPGGLQPARRDDCPDFVREYVAWGAGLRASQNIALAAKSFAAQDGRAVVRLADVRRAIVPVMRHRIGLAFRAEVDRVSVEDVIRRLVKAVPEPKA